MEIVRPRWRSWSFLLYAGGFTILGAAFAALGHFSSTHGDGAFAGFAFVIFAAAKVVAWLLRRDGRHPVAAGIGAVITVMLFATFVGALFSWFGWLDTGSSAFRGFTVSRLLLALLTLAAALVALRLYRFPLLVLIAVSTGWYFITDLLSGGGGWSAVVTFVIGLTYLAVAVSLDVGERHPYAFWLHVGAGLTIGGSLIYFLHHGDFEWALIALGGLAYVALAERLGRSSWAVLGAVGILASATHFARNDAFIGLVPFVGFGSSASAWRGPIVFAVAGLVLMALGGLLAARQRA
ncbi:MAG: hypothetical protein QOD85_1107, partial [Gaiellaceae bacterium]|nr:hypothetical protein [Gaiellaceae bacterium]